MSVAGTSGFPVRQQGNREYVLNVSRLTGTGHGKSQPQLPTNRPTLWHRTNINHGAHDSLVATCPLFEHRFWQQSRGNSWMRSGSDFR